MEVTLSGIVTEINEEQNANALFSIDMMLSEIVISVREVLRGQ